MLHERKNMIFVYVTVGIVFLASRYRNNVFQSVKHICRKITNADHKDENSEEIDKSNYKQKFPLNKVILAESPETCDYAIQCILR